MLKKINFALGFHNHQPVGNFPSVFEEMYKIAYLPFIEVMDEHPDIKLSLHYSGILFDWLCQEHPEFISQLKKLINRNQVELITGAYYEPILPIIPDRDKAGQIQKLTNFIQKNFQFKPRGMWLAERVWEPHIARSLAEAGIEYTLLDECHFQWAGLLSEEIHGYFVTEEQGFPLKIFPINYTLRRLIPFAPPEKTIEYLKEWATEGGERLLVMGDDGEKMGGWPGTHKTVYIEGWLDKFFTLLKENQDWVNMLTFSQYLDRYPARGRIYLPTASYYEMSEWALPVKAQKCFMSIVKEVKSESKDWYLPFLKGGFWRNFLTKYPESNNIHKKSLLVSKKVAAIKDRRLKAVAEEELWKGQCNCAYWHGIFGGLYLGHLRASLYQHLIRAEVIAERYLYRNNPWIKLEETDFDCDSHREVLISTDKLNLYLKPDKGGCLFEFDYKDKSWNFMDTISRREEAYHEKVKRLAEQNLSTVEEGLVSIHELERLKEKGLESDICYDWYQRSSLLDHFLHPSTTFDQFRACNYGEQGDFVNQPYCYKIKSNHSSAEIVFFRDGNIWYNGDFLPLRVEKSLKVSSGCNSFVVEYNIYNPNNRKLEIWFGSEYNFSFLGFNHPKSGFLLSEKGISHLLRESFQEGDVSDICIKDGARNINVLIGFTPASGVWTFPLETVSQSESGFEKVYQNTVILPHWKINLEPEATWHGLILVSLEDYDVNN